ncbi:MAG TPA: Gfo/Idh/MocA family oxidoreductase [Chloroflexi bacterium]|nr:Gfo/Idh/MocA family oxidoreductase [Chloroflexota bacterium]
MTRAAFNFMLTTPDNVRLVPEYGGGCLWDVGVYPVSFAQYIMGGPPEWVFGSQRLGETGVDVFFAGQMGYGDGRIAQISSSFSSPFYTMAEILGTEGSLLVTRPFINLDKGRVIYTPAGGQPEEIPIPDEYLYLGEVEDMHDAILNGQPNYLTLAESRNHVKTVLTLHESARTRQTIHLT